MWVLGYNWATGLVATLDQLELMPELNFAPSNLSA